MTKRDWWLGVAVITVAVVFHAVFPRYEWRTAMRPPARVDRWLGTMEIGRIEGGRWVSSVPAVHWKLELPSFLERWISSEKAVSVDDIVEVLDDSPVSVDDVVRSGEIDYDRIAAELGGTVAPSIDAEVGAVTAAGVRPKSYVSILASYTTESVAMSALLYWLAWRLVNRGPVRVRLLDRWHVLGVGVTALGTGLARVALALLFGGQSMTTLWSGRGVGLVGPVAIPIVLATSSAILLRARVGYTAVE